MAHPGPESNTVPGAPGPDPANASVGELVGHVAQDLSTLMRQELDLAKAEVKQEVTKTAKGAGMLGGAGFAGYMVVLFGSIALWWGLANLMDQGWAALVVTGLWAVIAAVLFVVGRARLKQVNPKPEQTVETVKELPDTIKGAVRS
ncbi:MAG TPA: phage holin family protein [Streptosporangiaceae bacterium]|nr:phage holin family protein [Streptosporangiaceae bacterium]